MMATGAALTLRLDRGDPAHAFALVNGLRLHRLDWGGDGRPIILLHGVGGHAWMWSWIAPALRAHGRPIAPDLRGYGDSQWSAERAYRTEEHASDLAALCASLTSEPVDLVGFSWGGLVALAFASEHPDRVRRVAIIDIPPATEQPPDAIPPAFRGRFADHADAVEAERVLAPGADAGVLALMAAFGSRSHPDGGLTRKLDPYLLSRWPFRADDRWDELRGLRAPTLVVHAQDSVVLAADEARRMVAEAPDARLETIADSGHLVALERPDALARALIDHLAYPAGSNR
ncbi:MAG: alpha/beta fold hydrolase [Solirubrobacterales bacterium]|nr:alpha/beta fold hydrolase [Solirubrobacterales bacterium]